MKVQSNSLLSPSLLRTRFYPKRLYIINHLHARDAVTREARLKRDMAHRRAIKFGTYKALRNKENSVLRSAKALYYRQLSDDLRQNPRKFWKEFHRLPKTSASTCIPEHTPDELNTSNGCLQNYRWFHLTRLWSVIILAAPKRSIPRLWSWNYWCWLGKQTVIKSKPTASDNIPARFLKTCNHLIAQPLSHLINHSLKEAYNIYLQYGNKQILLLFTKVAARLSQIIAPYQSSPLSQLTHHLIETDLLQPTSQASGLVTPLIMCSWRMETSNRPWKHLTQLILNSSYSKNFPRIYGVKNRSPFDLDKELFRQKETMCPYK